MKYNVPLRYFLLLIVCFYGLLYADAAPPIFPGYSLSLFKNKDIRMTNQKVDIYYDTVCRIKAEFKIVNPGKSTVKKNIGFPFNIVNYRPSFKDTTLQLYDFTFFLNGVRQKVADKEQDSKIEYATILRSVKKDWYGWTCEFKPGLNVINLTYNTIPGHSNRGYSWAKLLHYDFCQSENNEENIDNAQVTIHFPGKIQARQILKQTSPENYHLTDSSISWKFVSLSPKSHQNIVLEIFDFPQFKKLITFDKLLTSSNIDNKTKLDAATFFASLAPSRGMDAIAPGSFLRSYYEQTILPALLQSEREIFSRIYKLSKGYENTEYYRFSDYKSMRQNDTLQKMIRNIMYRVGYFENIQYPEIFNYIETSKRLFSEIVKSEPQNASFWKAYIENFQTIETDACAPCSFRPRYDGNCPDSQKNIVAQAYKNCGNDSIISLWYRFLFTPRIPLANSIKIVNVNKNKSLDIKIRMNEGGGRGKTLAHDTLAFVKKFYTVSNDQFLVRNKQELDLETHKKLAEILEAHYYYGYLFCKELDELKKHKK